MLTAAHFLFLAVRAVLLLALDIISPPTCAACDTAISRRRVFCPSCALTVIELEENGHRPGDGDHPGDGEQPRLDERVASSARGAARPPGSPRVIAFAAFGGAVAVALRRLKFTGRPDLGRPLGHLARHAVRSVDLCADVVVPVPLHARRLAERGYNQAALIGHAVAAELRVPLAARALVRVRSTARQATLDRPARFENVREAFRVRDAAAVQGRRVALVDDVLTTGATMDACALALLDAGAVSVTAVVVARAGSDDADQDAITDEPASAARRAQAKV
jgi:ComF family protein